jgi:hypothetical protein
VVLDVNPEDLRPTPAASISRLVSSAKDRVRAPSMTLAPAAAKAIATPLPIPRPAPVTITALLANDSVILVSFPVCNALDI